jgi:prepilin-type N-terminal cleavage/methylation domain-containing protein/prepilin-type processing-associated H-X9-DG protein
MNAPHRAPPRAFTLVELPAVSKSQRAAFTLVELLVVIGIIAILIGVLLPALTRAQSQARAVTCMANLRSIGQALINYTSDNKGFIVPAYNLPFAPGATSNYTGGPNQPLDGWACILDRDRFARSAARSNNTIFYCPDTANEVNSLENGATGTTVGINRGWVEWPLIFTTVGGDTNPKQALTIPAGNFNKILRVSYWLNAYHPTGQTLSAAQIVQKDLYYSTVAGFGPDITQQIRPHKSSSIRHSALTIAVADGVFMGRQSVDQVGMTNSVIGFRHTGANGKRNFAANACFADGHVEALMSPQFPCAYATTSTYAANNGQITYAQQKAQNLTSATVYPNPETALQLFLLANPGAN